MSQCAKVSLTIYPQDVCFIDLFPCFGLPGITFITQALLHSCKKEYIKASKDVGDMGQIAEHHNLVHVSVIEEVICVMWVMAVYEQESITTIGFFHILTIELFDPF